VVPRSKAWVYGRPAYWDCGFEFHRGHGCLSVVSVMCCQVEISASGWSLVQRCPTECGVFKLLSRSLEKMRRPRPPRGCEAIGGGGGSCWCIKQTLSFKRFNCKISTYCSYSMFMCYDSSSNYLSIQRSVIAVSNGRTLCSLCGTNWMYIMWINFSLIGVDIN
jgi:hypothetical protein